MDRREDASRVQHDLTAWPSDDPFDRADRALRPWLERAMQKRPAPDLLWRTATRDHRLGNVDVAADDRVFVGIVSALAEDAAAGITDVCPIFGGDRGAPDAPLHACPAYKAAMGTMLGIISVLLENFRIEPLPAPLLVRLEGRSPLMRQLIASPEVAAASAAVIEAGKRAAAKPAQSAILPGLPVPPPATKPPAAKPAAQRPAAKGGLKQPRDPAFFSGVRDDEGDGDGATGFPIDAPAK